MGSGRPGRLALSRGDLSYSYEPEDFFRLNQNILQTL
jgi:hypothetical protein